MNDLLKQRIARALDALSDERGYQILDYIEFLESKYAERARPGGIFAKLTETVEDTMRAGKLPIQAISGTMGLMDSAAKVMKGLAAAGQAVVDEAVKAAEDATKRSPTVTPPKSWIPTVESCHPERSEAGHLRHGPPSLVQVTWLLTAQRRGDMAAPARRAHDRAIHGVHPRHRSARRDLAGGRLDDRLGDLHRLGRHQPAGVALGARRPAAGLGHHRADDRDRRALLRRAGGDDAEGRRPVRVPARGAVARRGLPLRLDALRGHPDRHHRGGGRGVRPVPQRAGAVGVSPDVFLPLGTAPPARRARRDPARPLAPARRRDPARSCCSPRSTSAACGSARRSRRCSAWPRSARSRRWCCSASPSSASRTSRRPTSPTFWGTGDWTPRDDPGGRRRHGRLALLQRRLEQRDLRRGRGAEPEPQPAAGAGGRAPGW